MTKGLVGEALPTSKLSDLVIQNMFNLFRDYYEADFDNFQQDLSNKNWVILLRDTEAGSIQGFSTLAFYKSTTKGGEIGVVYSGDTIIRPAYWGTPELPRAWIKNVLEIGNELPNPLYWLLISSGYKTYRFLTVFYKEFFPRYDQPTPPEIQALIHHLAHERFGSEYDPQLGIVRFTSGATPLREGVSVATERRMKDPHVAFFVNKNKGYAEGDELVCVAQVHPDNFTPAGIRMIR